MRKPALLLVAAVLVGAVLLWNRELPQPAAPTVTPATTASAQPDAAARLPAFLPAEARVAIDLIQRDGPFPHRQDGAVFGNRERLLPAEPRGYYHEYTVETPGLDHRGARRIVTGGTPPEVWYYTDDHYDSFRRFEVPR